MDAHTARQFGFLLAEHARTQGMVAENVARQVRGEAPAYTEDDFNRQAFHIENIAREITG